MQARQAFAEDYVGGFVILMGGIVASLYTGLGHERSKCVRSPLCPPYPDRSVEERLEWEECIAECTERFTQENAQAMVLVSLGFISSVLSFIARYASSRGYMKCAKRAEKADELNSKLQDLYLGEPVGVGPVAVTIGAV